MLAKPRSAPDWAIVAASIRCDRLTQGWDFRTAGRAALRTKFVWWSALPMLVALPSVANAQSQPAPTATTPAPEQTVDFSSDQVVYDSDADVVTADGAVRMMRDGQYLAADRVSGTQNRRSSARRAMSSCSRLRAISSLATMPFSPTKCMTRRSAISWWSLEWRPDSGAARHASR